MKIEFGIWCGIGKIGKNGGRGVEKMWKGVGCGKWGLVGGEERISKEIRGKRECRRIEG